MYFHVSIVVYCSYIYSRSTLSFAAINLTYLIKSNMYVCTNARWQTTSFPVLFPPLVTWVSLGKRRKKSWERGWMTKITWSLHNAFQIEYPIMKYDNSPSLWCNVYAVCHALILQLAYVQLISKHMVSGRQLFFPI